MAIPTLYQGIEYRSRLEARWAALFDQLGWKHTYEPVDGNGYIPDFLIHGGRPLLVEVKPAFTVAEYRKPLDKITAGLADHWQHDILVVGVDPLPQLGVDAWGGNDFPAAGLLGESGGDDPERSGWDFAAGCWLSCNVCGQDGVFHEYQWYVSRPCGHYEGDHHMGSARTRWIQEAWRKACNEVKWYGKDVA